MNLLIGARRPLLAGLFEYSGLRGSAQPPLKQAVLKYQEAVAGPHGWIIGRFLCPTSQLEELAALLTVSMRPGERPWHIGAVVDELLGPAAMHASVFDTYMDPAGSIASLETTGGPDVSAAALATAAAGVSPSVTAFVSLGESHQQQDLVHLADTERTRLQPIGAAVDPSMDSSQLAVVVEQSVRLDIPFKLNLPPRQSADLKFLKILAAAALAHRGAAIDLISTLLRDDTPGAVTATAVGLRWRDELLGVPDINNARTTVQTLVCADLDVATVSVSDLLV